MQIHKFNKGFTLLEILLALFIFSLVSMMLMKGLHTLLNVEERTEQNAERLRELQKVLLLLSRNIEQAIDRPVTDSLGGEELTFIGTGRGFTFTHLGNSGSLVPGKSNLKRTGYYFNEGALWKMTWPVLDQSAKTKPRQSKLLGNISAARFRYIDQDRHYNDKWPTDDLKQKLPSAIKISFKIEDWGEISQVYVIPAS